MSVHPCQETDIDIKPSISSLKGSLGRRVKCRYSITSIQDEQQSEVVESFKSTYTNIPADNSEIEKLTIKKDGIREMTMKTITISTQCKNAKNIQSETKTEALQIQADNKCSFEDSSEKVVVDLDSEANVEKKVRCGCSGPFDKIATVSVVNEHGEAIQGISITDNVSVCIL